jgi:hypothetical protein
MCRSEWKLEERALHCCGLFVGLHAEAILRKDIKPVAVSVRAVLQMATHKVEIPLNLERQRIPVVC